MLVQKSTWIKRLVADTMLATKRSAGTAPEVNLRNLLHMGNKVCKWGNPPWLWNPGQMSPKVQNRGISGPIEKTGVLQKIKSKKTFNV